MSKITNHHKGLGYIVLYGTTSTEHVTHKQALDCIQKHGLPDDLLIPPSPKKAFSRCIKETEKLTSSKFAREVGETANNKATAIIREEHEANATEFEFKVETIATLDKTRRKMTATRPDKARVEARFEHYFQNVIGDDLRQMSRRELEALGGISLRGSAKVRDAGGIYFVPKRHAKHLEALSNVLEELQIGYLKTFGVMRGKVEQESLFATAAAHIEKEVIAINEAVANLQTRASSARHYRKQLERLKDLLLEYATLSEMLAATEPLLVRLEATSALVEKKIAELTAKRDSHRHAIVSR